MQMTEKFILTEGKYDMDNNNTYDQILKRMCDSFFENSGAYPQENSESMKRLTVLAGEIHALYCQLSRIKESVFVSDACGEALEKHAAHRGLTRHRGKKALGTIVVRVDTPLEYDLMIPSGTVFSTSDGELQYISMDDAVIYRGTASCLVDIEAEYSGSRYNIPPRNITTVVTYFSSGINITNSSAAYGGSDDESDESLRKRIIDSCRNISNGLNPTFYKKLAESADGIYSAKVSEIPNNNTVNVYIAAKGDGVDNSVVAEVQQLMDANRIPGMSINVYSAVSSTVDISINFQIKSGYIVSTVIDNIENAVNEFFSELKVGQDLILTQLGAKIISVEGVANYSFVGASDVVNSELGILKLGSLTVTRV